MVDNVSGMEIRKSVWQVRIWGEYCHRGGCCAEDSSGKDSEDACERGAGDSCGARPPSDHRALWPQLATRSPPRSHLCSPRVQASCTFQPGHGLERPAHLSCKPVPPCSVACPLFWPLRLATVTGCPLQGNGATFLHQKDLQAGPFMEASIASLSKPTPIRSSTGFPNLSVMPEVSLCCA